MSGHAGFLAGIITAFMIVMLGRATGPDDIEASEQLYCEMTRLHAESGGEYGWPDYKGSRERVCQDV